MPMMVWKNAARLVSIPSSGIVLLLPVEVAPGVVEATCKVFPSRLAGLFCCYSNQIAAVAILAVVLVSIPSSGIVLLLPAGECAENAVVGRQCFHPV